jgi:hypothetical protein
VETQSLEEQIQSQETSAASLNEALKELLAKKTEVQSRNRAESEAIDRQFGDYKAMQEKAKAEGALNAELRNELTLLRGRKSKVCIG